jgi:hypothetical protein
MSEQQPQVSSDRVIEILTREAMGAALWRAAVAEATVEAYQQRLAELTQDKTPSRQTALPKHGEDPRG